ncbi:hypothetical protein ACTXT7_017437 [Hymenolepis weldensis]
MSRPNPANYVERLLYNMKKLQAIPTLPTSNRNIILPDLKSHSHAFLHHDAVHPPVKETEKPMPTAQSERYIRFQIVIRLEHA